MDSFDRFCIGAMIVGLLGLCIINQYYISRLEQKVKQLETK